MPVRGPAFAVRLPWARRAGNWDDLQLQGEEAFPGSLARQAGVPVIAVTALAAEYLCQGGCSAAGQKLMLGRRRMATSVGQDFGQLLQQMRF